VTPAERDAYGWFRQSYQRQWRNFFDPIAVRFVLEDSTIKADMSVRPLIAASEYRDFMRVTGTQQLPPGAGDPHPEAAAQFAMALDVESEPVRRFGNFATQMAPGIEANALNWIGKWLSVYVDADPFWDEAAVAAKAGERGVQKFMERNFWRAPVALHVDVGNAFKLTGFLATLRGFLEQTAPGMTTWETRKHGERSYVVIRPSEEARGSMGDDEGWQELSVLYAVTGKAFILTLNESLLKRALDRLAAPPAAPDQAAAGQPTPKPWLGDSVAARGTGAALNMIQALYGENMRRTLRRRAWGNLFILNEWRQRFGAPDAIGFHRRFWQTQLVCPGGGTFAWNDEFQTFESTVFGAPAVLKPVAALPDPLQAIAGLDLGLTFEGDGLRARAEVQRK